MASVIGVGGIFGALFAIIVLAFASYNDRYYNRVHYERVVISQQELDEQYTEINKLLNDIKTNLTKIEDYLDENIPK